MAAAGCQGSSLTVVPISTRAKGWAPMTVDAQAHPHADTPAAGSASARLAGLDGLRAVAIAAVFTFHLNPAWLPGGFLGVDVFFVVSGFLITTLLEREYARTGTIDLPGFWTRRARRLLPALFVCVPVSVLLARIVEADLLVGIGRQVLGALTFSTNWLEIAAGSDYFNATTPQLFMNFWSLAVEEQFYLVWPLVTVLLVTYVPRWTHRVAIAGALGLTSTLLMAALFDPAAGSTRVYYGTDSHLMGLMFGAALAFGYAAPDHGPLAHALWSRVRRPATGAAFVLLAALLLVLDESSPWTFRGGLALASLCTAVLIAGVVDGTGRAERVLDLAALRWVGERSYGIYLWHWPVILIVGSDLPSAPGAPGYVWTRAWCVIVTLALADLSYRFVESPVRRDGWRTTINRLVRPTTHHPALGTVAVGVVASSLVLVLVVLVTAPNQTSTQRLIEANEAAAARASATMSGTSSPTASRPASTPTTASGTKTVVAGNAAFTMPSGTEIDAYGDSMMVGSWHALRYYFPGIRIDAKSNRRYADGLAQVTLSGDKIRRAVILSFGTNAGVEEEDVRSTLDRLGPARMVVLVNLHLNMSRTAKDNATLERVSDAYPNVIVADWNAAVTANPRQLQPDGIHPSLVGAHLYAKTIRQAFATLSAQHTGVAVKLKTLPIP